MNATTITNTNHLPTPLRILVAEDEPEIRDYLQLALRRPNFAIDFAEDGEEVIHALANNGEAPALVILDVVMPGKDGLTTLKEIRYRDHKTPVIMLSGVSSPSNREEAMENGANGFLTKPVSYEELRRVVDGFLNSAAPLPIPKRPFGTSGKLEPNLKSGNWARGMEPLLNRLAASDVPILLQGETGVGKEVLARYIHNQSLRAGKTFLKLNCAALPPELVESELFGYEKGAFTGAFKSTCGKFELADGGTILLDEIGDMDLRLQAKLLHVLQDHEFHRIGAKEPTQVDVRVIAATHRDLTERIAQGEFREDLYYRLNVLSIVIPPLRERLDEIIPLATYFLKKHAAGMPSIPEIGAALRSALLSHSWAGNIRELENVMRRYLIVRNPEMIIEELERIANKAGGSNRPFTAHVNYDMPSQSSGHDALTSLGPFNPPASPLPAERVPVKPLSAHQAKGQGTGPVKLDQVRQAVESEVIMKALYSTQWNRKRAAALLGVDYKALLYKMKKLAID